MRLERQLCFPLYAASREVTKLYKPLLDPFGLTYTQYIVMLTLWEYRELSVRDLGERLYLDSGTLTPVLKRLEHAGLITRLRDISDERRVVISLSQAGKDLQERLKDIPQKLQEALPLEAKETKELHKLLYKLLEELAHQNATEAKTFKTSSRKDLIG